MVTKSELSLGQLKTLLIAKKKVNLASLANYFQEDPVLIQQMLLHFIHKGQVVETRLTKHCGTSCQSCEVSETILYEWQQNA